MQIPAVSKTSPDILVVTRNLPPLVGGMERLGTHMVEELARDHHVHVVGPRGCQRHLPSSVASVSTVPLKPVIGFLLLAGLATLWRSLRHRPVCILAGSGLTAPASWIAAKVIGAKSVVYLHGLDVEARHIAYRTVWIPILRRCDGIFANSEFTKRLAIQARISQDRIHILHPGVHLPDLSSADQLRDKFRRAHGLGETPLLLFVGRITPRKGLLEFVKHIFPRIVEQIPSARLVVVGDEPAQSILPQTGQMFLVRQWLRSSPLGKNVIFTGTLFGSALDAAYFAANLLIFPIQSLPHDHEGFGMVALEAAAHGIPTVAFESGGVGQAVDCGKSGQLIAPGDNSAFAQAVIDLLQDSQNPQTPLQCREFARNFAWDKFGEQLNALCQGLVTSLS